MLCGVCVLLLFIVICFLKREGTWGWVDEVVERTWEELGGGDNSNEKITKAVTDNEADLREFGTWMTS